MSGSVLGNSSVHCWQNCPAIKLHSWVFPWQVVRCCTYKSSTSLPTEVPDTCYHALFSSKDHSLQSLWGPPQMPESWRQILVPPMVVSWLLPHLIPSCRQSTNTSQNTNGTGRGRTRGELCRAEVSACSSLSVTALDRQSNPKRA